MDIPESDIDSILCRVQEQVPDVTIRQLDVIHPADDDNLWFLDLPNAKSILQIEGHKLPFLIETGEQALKGATVDEAVEIITRYLQSVKDGAPLTFDGPFYWSRYHETPIS